MKTILRIKHFQQKIASKYLEDFFVHENEGFEGADLDDLNANHHLKVSAFHKKQNASQYEQKHLQVEKEDKKSENIQKSNELPEANPLLSSSKPTDFKPRILIKDFKYMDLPYILNHNVDTAYKNRHDSDQEEQNNEETPSTTILQQQEEETQPVQDDDKVSQSLFQKYELSKKYERVYSKYKLEKSVEDQVKSFASYYINLSYVMDFGSTMFNTFEENKMNKPEYHYEFDLYNRIDQGKQEEFSRNQEQISFDSRFESGNLYQVYTKNPNKEYDLLLQNDINTKGYNQWFFFKVSNYKFKGLTVRFNITNLAKASVPFKQGMKISVYSINENKNKNCGWVRKGKNMSYYKNRIIKEQDANQYYYTLSFSYTFKHEDDEVYFAMNTPYTYTKMIQHLDQAISKTIKSQPNIIVKKDILCYSVSNNAVPMLSITERTEDAGETNKEQLKNKNKKLVFMIARQHPGETVCSYKMEGVINHLLSDAPEAVYLRSQFIFKIIPMMNPDGVIYGNFRCNISGVDINRQWMQPSRILHPSVYHTKKMIASLREEGLKLEYFIDLHGHSKKMNSFIYACRKEDDLISCRVFPVIYSKISSVFQFKDCTFSLEQYKESAARIVMWNEVNKIKDQMFECFNIFTVETSFFGYKVGRKNVHFLISDLLELGGDLLKSMYINSKAEDKELYPHIIRQQIIDKMSEDIQQFIEKECKDSGSDSDPLADELNIDEKLGSIIPIKIAKKLGFEVKTKQNEKNQANVNTTNGMTNSAKDKNKKFKKKTTGLNPKAPQFQGQQIVFQQLQTIPMNNTSINTPQKDQSSAATSTNKAKSSGVQDFSQSISGAQVASSFKKRNSLLFSDSQAHKFQNRQKSKFHRGLSDNRANTLGSNGIQYLTTEENAKANSNNNYNNNMIETTPFNANLNDTQKIQPSSSIVVMSNPELIQQSHEIILGNNGNSGKKVVIINQNNSSNLIQQNNFKTSTPLQGNQSPSNNINISPHQLNGQSKLKEASIIVITEKNKIFPNNQSDASQLQLKQKQLPSINQKNQENQMQSQSPLTTQYKQPETPIRTRQPSDNIRQQITLIQTLTNQQSLHIAQQTTLNSANISNQFNQNLQLNSIDNNAPQPNTNSSIVINTYQSNSVANPILNNQQQNQQQNSNNQTNRLNLQIHGSNTLCNNSQINDQNIITNNSAILSSANADQLNNSQPIKIKNSPNPQFQIKQRNISGGGVIKKQDLRTKSSTTHQNQPANIEMAIIGNAVASMQNSSVNNNNSMLSSTQMQQLQNMPSTQLSTNTYTNNRLVNVGYQSLIQKVQLLGMQKKQNTRDLDESTQSPLKYQHSLQTQTERQSGIIFQQNTSNSNNTQIHSVNALDENNTAPVQNKQFQQVKLYQQQQLNSKLIDKHLVRSSNKPFSQGRNTYTTSKQDSNQVNKTDVSYNGNNHLSTQPDENYKNYSSSPKRQNTQISQKTDNYHTTSNNNNNSDFLISNQFEQPNMYQLDMINSSINGPIMQNQKIIRITQTKLVPVKDDNNPSSNVLGDTSSSFAKPYHSPLQLLGRNPSQKKFQIQQQQQNQSNTETINIARTTLRSSSLQKGSYIQVKEPQGQDPLMLTFTRLNRNQTNNANTALQKDLAGIESNRQRVQQPAFSKADEINYNKKYQAAQRSLKLNQLMINEAKLNSANLAHHHNPNKQVLPFNDAHLVNKL